MLKAIIKHGSLSLLVLTGLFLSGCSTPEEKRAEQLEEARALSEQGMNEAAIQLLEALAVDYPNDAEILHALGRLYASEEDPTMAAFFLEQAHQQDPANVELLFQTYQALERSGQPSGEALSKLAQRSPESMTDALWIRLGQYRAENNQNESALQAYLKGANLKGRKPSPGTAASIGQLFARVGNPTQAERWFEAAADSDDPNAMTALFGLLEIQLQQKRWSDAEATIDRLDTQFPGAVDASQWAQARRELKRWRAAQETMKARLAAAAAERESAEEAAADQPVEVIEDEATTDPNAPSETATATAGTTETETDTAGESENGDNKGKAQVISDMEAAEAMAMQPALETAVDPNPATAGAGVAFNPDIVIEPADPDFSFNVTFEEQALAPQTNYNLESPLEADQPATTTDFDPDALAASATPTNFIGPPKTLEALLAEAESAELDRDYKSAIRKYWAAIGITNNRPDIWNLLARAYRIDGQLENAETAALEAIRLEPDEVAYTLDYLRIAQRTKKPDQFLSHLETAYDRFPASPEITLSLARAYERISQDRPEARRLFQRFIDIAPSHPLVPEARDAVARLR